MAGLLAPELCPADVVVVLPVVAVVVVFCEGRAAAVTGRGWEGVSDDPPLVPGDDCTLKGLEKNTEINK